MSDDKTPLHADVVELDPDLIEVIEIDQDMIEIVDDPGFTVSAPAAAVDDAAPSAAPAPAPPPPMGQGKEDRPDPVQFKELPADIEWSGLPSSFDLPPLRPAAATAPQEAAQPSVQGYALMEDMPIPSHEEPPVPPAAHLGNVETGGIAPLSADAMAEMEMSEYGMAVIDDSPPLEDAGLSPAPETPLPPVAGISFVPEPMGITPMDADQAAMLLIEDDYLPEAPAPVYDALPPREDTPLPIVADISATPLEPTGVVPMDADQAAMLLVEDEYLPEEPAPDYGALPPREETPLPPVADISSVPPEPVGIMPMAADEAATLFIEDELPPSAGLDAPLAPPTEGMAQEGGTAAPQADAETDTEDAAGPLYPGDDEQIADSGAPGIPDLPDLNGAGEDEKFVDETASMVATIGAPFASDEELSDAFPEDEDGLADLTGQEEDEQEAETEEEEPEEPKVDTQWTINDPGKHQPFLMSFTEDQMLLFSGSTVKQLQSIGECTSYFTYLVDFESSNSMGVTDLQGEFKFAEVMLRKSLEEQGELGRDAAVHVYYKRRKTKSLTTILYQIYPKNRLDAIQRAYAFYQDGFIIYDTLGMLVSFIQTLNPKVTHALALRTQEAILFVVGQGTEIFSARRIVMLGDDEASLTEGIFALQREADAINSSIPGELEHIEWIVPYSEQLLWKPHPAWKIPIKLRPVTRLKMGDKTVYTALPSMLEKLKPDASLGPKDEKLLRPMEKAERWLWAALLLLSIGFAGSFYYVAGMADAATDENDRISMQIKAVERRMPQLPNYLAKDIKPVLSMADTINTAAFSPPLAEVWNRLAQTKPKACRLDSVTFAYRNEGISIGLSGEVELGLAHAQRVFAEFIEQLVKGGFQVKNQSISLDIQGNQFQLDILLPLEDS